ncbi:TPA: hypothetical protein ACGUMU_004211, partial [Vibrio vulnificus]
QCETIPIFFKSRSKYKNRTALVLAKVSAFLCQRRNAAQTGDWENQKTQPPHAQRGKVSVI